MNAVPDDFDMSELKAGNKEGLAKIQFDADIARDPVDKPRRCTDIFCCMLFTATFVGMIVCSFIGYISGDPWKLVAPIDGDSKICGWSEGYEEYSHLYIGDIENALGGFISAIDVFDYGVCVKECPTEKTDEILCMTTGKVDYCQPKTGEAYTTYEFLSYCIPNVDSLPDDVKEAFESVSESILGGSAGTAASDIMTSKWVILISVFVCLVVTMIYIFMMHYCAFWLSWISVGLIQVALIAIGYFAMAYRKD